jgi:ferritin-like metal-binding protein YciE
MSTTDAPARDAKLTQYLSEALGNEKRLETALQAHIAMTTRPPYKRRLREHLTETRRHARELTRRIKQLGGPHDPVPGPLGDAAGAVVGGAHKASALAQGPLHALRGTGEEERQLKNAKTEYGEEAQEIGMYSAIETLAVAVNDKETAKLARTILRDERRMLTYLEREIPRLATAVARAEIPARQRGAAGRPRSRKAGTAARRASTRRAGGRSGSRAGTRRSGSPRASRARTGSARARG